MTVVGSLFSGVVSIVLIGMAMRSAPRAAAASYVSIVLGISNASGIVGNLVGGELSGNAEATFQVGAIVTLAGLLSLPLFSKKAYLPPPPQPRAAATPPPSPPPPGAAAAAAGEEPAAPRVEAWGEGPLVAQRANPLRAAQERSERGAGARARAADAQR